MVCKNFASVFVGVEVLFALFVKKAVDRKVGLLFLCVNVYDSSLSV